MLHVHVCMYVHSCNFYTVEYVATDVRTYKLDLLEGICLFGPRSTLTPPPICQKDKLFQILLNPFPYSVSATDAKSQVILTQIKCIKLNFTPKTGQKL